jgi:hypothetical protein
LPPLSDPFPRHLLQLARLVKDNFIYARAAQLIGDRSALDESKLEALTDILGEEEDVRRPGRRRWVIALSQKT